LGESCEKRPAGIHHKQSVKRMGIKKQKPGESEMADSDIARFGNLSARKKAIFRCLSDG